MSNRKRFHPEDTESLHSARPEDKKEVLEDMKLPVSGFNKLTALSSQNKTSNNEDFDDENMSKSFDGSFESDSEFSDEGSIEEPKSPEKEKPSQIKSLEGPEITLLDLENKCLQAVYNEELDEVKFELTNFQRINDYGKSFKRVLLLAFWLAVYLEKREITQYLFQQDEILEK